MFIWFVKLFKSSPSWLDPTLILARIALLCCPDSSHTMPRIGTGSQCCADGQLHAECPVGIAICNDSSTTYEDTHSALLVHLEKAAGTTHNRSNERPPL